VLEDITGVSWQAVLHVSRRHCHCSGLRAFAEVRNGLDNPWEGCGLLGREERDYQAFCIALNREQERRASKRIQGPTFCGGTARTLRVPQRTFLRALEHNQIPSFLCRPLLALPLPVPSCWVLSLRNGFTGRQPPSKPAPGASLKKPCGDNKTQDLIFYNGQRLALSGAQSARVRE
jgi:hypothetical protein